MPWWRQFAGICVISLGFKIPAGYVIPTQACGLAGIYGQQGFSSNSSYQTVHSALLNYNIIFASYRFHPRITTARNDIEGKNF
jgi:hypothetical protein